MKLVDNTKMTEAWNTAYELHRRDTPQCDVPQMELANKKKWGVCWKVPLKCVKRCFQTSEFKLYKEVSTRNPGPNPGAPNVGLGIGLQDTPLGNKDARLLMATMDVPKTARSSMQRTSKKVAKQVNDLNEKNYG